MSTRAISKSHERQARGPAFTINRHASPTGGFCVRIVKGIRGLPAGRFRKYEAMRKFLIRLINGPQQI
jgi:hypothetical protein